MFPRSKFHYLIVFMICLPLASLLYSQKSAKKVHIAVFDFEGRGISQEEAKALTDRFRSVLVSTNKFIVVEREKIKLILEEIGLQMSGAVSGESLSEAGKLLGVQRIITGSIGKIGDTYTVDLRVIAVETGKVIGTISENTSGSRENLIALLERLAKRFAGIKTALRKYEVKIFSKPGSGSVYVDGKYIGLSPLVVKLEEGVHQIKIQRSGYKVWKGKVKVSRNGKIIAKLEKRPSRRKTWFWIGAGTLVAGGGIAAAVLLGSHPAKVVQPKKEPIGLPPLPPGE